MQFRNASAQTVWRPFQARVQPHSSCWRIYALAFVCNKSCSSLGSTQSTHLSLGHCICSFAVTCRSRQILHANQTGTSTRRSDREHKQSQQQTRNHRSRLPTHYQRESSTRLTTRLITFECRRRRRQRNARTDTLWMMRYTEINRKHDNHSLR